MDKCIVNLDYLAEQIVLKVKCGFARLILVMKSLIVINAVIFLSEYKPRNRLHFFKLFLYRGFSDFLNLDHGSTQFIF